MSATAEDVVSDRPSGGLSFLWRRQLDSYPDTRARVTYLAITVLATVMLYYELYVGGSVSTFILPNLGMSFTFFVTTLAIGNLIGAFGSLFAGLTDRLGRANLVVFGLLFTGVFVGFILPAATNKWVYTIEGFVVGIVEGICLVATPALIRDFSPQVGRATAMGFWTSGPVLGSLIVAVVGTWTIPAVVTNPRFWTHEYVICGIAGLVVFVIALIGLKELSPQLRDQLMVTMRDRALIEARAKGIDIAAALKNPFRQLLKADVVVSAFAVSIMLLIYYTAVGFAVIYFTTVFPFTVKQANGLGNWNWGFNVIAVILVGWLSDKVRVRKPFMVIGGVLAAVMTVIYLLQAGHQPSYYSLALILAALSFGLGIAYTPWMASFTETVEARNPALTATGLAIWGWIIRVVVCASFLVIPHVITSVTPLVTYGAQVAGYAKQYPALVFAGSHQQVVADATKYNAELSFAAANPDIVALAQKDKVQLANAVKFAPELKVIQANPALFTKLASFKDPSKIPPALAAQAVKAAGGGSKGVALLGQINANKAAINGVIAVAPDLQKIAPFGKQLTALAAVPPSVIAEVTPFAAELTALAKVPKSVDAFMAAHAGAVAAAAAKAPGQWKTWYWICFGGIIFFLLSIPLLRGRWRPSDARKDEAEHEAMVEAELAALHV
ncbi:MAG TPA: MFS transporter [Streptosporangiaceae bacterium]|nr:MFS transporter [Streptosporangiaceae bacterium]